MRALRHANGFDRWIADDALEDLDVVGGDERIAAINPSSYAPIMVPGPKKFGVL